MNENLWKDFLFPLDEQRGKKTGGDFQQDFRVQGIPELTLVLRIKPSALNIIDTEPGVLISITFEEAPEGILDGPLSRVVGGMGLRE